MYKLIIILCLISFSSYAQDYIYRPNAFGEVVIYSRNANGLETEVGTMRKNAFGEVEVQNAPNYTKEFNKDHDPYSNHMQYTAVKPYLRDVASQVNEYNAYLQYTYQTRETSNTNVDHTFENKIQKGIDEMYAEMGTKANYFIDFYNHFASKPKELKNGLKSCIIIKSDENDELVKAFKPTSKIHFTTGFAWIENNRIVSYIEKAVAGFREYLKYEKNTFVTGNIEECVAVLKQQDDIKKFYFIDNLIDKNSEATYPPLTNVRFKILNPSTANFEIAVIYNSDPQQNPNDVAGGDAPDRSGRFSVGMLLPPGTYYYKAFTKDYSQKFTGTFKAIANDNLIINLY